MRSVLGGEAILKHKIGKRENYLALQLIITSDSLIITSDFFAGGTRNCPTKNFSLTENYFLLELFLLKAGNLGLKAPLKIKTKFKIFKHPYRVCRKY